LAVACIVGSVAAADDQGSLGTVRDDRVGAKFLLFSGADFWRAGAFVHGGLMWSPAGLDREGFTFKLLVGGGTYRYLSGALDTEVIGRQFLGAAMAGWRFKFDGLEATVFLGPDIQDHKLTPDDLGARLRGHYFGARGGVEVWYQPRPEFMAAVNASGSTAGSQFSLRGAFGWRLLDKLFVGPEAQALGCIGYQQYRLGAHATGLKLGAFEWSAAAGWADDSDHRSGAYGRLGALARY
jgi:hypothetical protein